MFEVIFLNYILVDVSAFLIKLQKHFISNSKLNWDDETNGGLFFFN